ncbi:MAG: LPP20 family lipoprotein [Deltaproteobacteria bacterium]|nr:LPP20 family lipoprotein [Deltaproteobacteria bacterium]
MKAALFALATLSVIVGCGPSMPGPSDPLHGVTPDGKPRWVTRGSGAFDSANGKAFFGVGIVAGIRNPALSRQTADNRARGEIAKMFDVYIAAMMKDYQRSTTAGDFKASAEEQDVVSAQKTITEVTLRGVEMRDHWTDPADGSLYALAVLDLNAMMKTLDDAHNLNDKVRTFVRANARKAFNDLDAELRKRRESGR